MARPYLVHEQMRVSFSPPSQIRRDRSCVGTCIQLQPQAPVAKTTALKCSKGKVAMLKTSPLCGYRRTVSSTSTHHITHPPLSNTRGVHNNVFTLRCSSEDTSASSSLDHDALFKAACEKGVEAAKVRTVLCTLQP
eukprot:6259887-Pyramimonas_sp.AAC.1